MAAPELAPGGIPRILWMLWLQGEPGMPLVVRKCVESWRRWNPGWDIRVLDDESINRYLDVPLIRRPHLTNQGRADLSRVNLLAQYGGVWSDATCYCLRPLDEWLPAYTPSGFFGFASPGGDRALSTWFLASSRGNRLTERWRDLCNEYQASSRMEGDYVRRDRSGLNRFVFKQMKHALNRNRETTRGWFSFFVRRVLRIYPYFWLQYVFDRVLERDAEARAIWEATPKFPASIPHRLHTHGLLEPATDELRDFIARRESPVLKLTWRYDAERYGPGTALHYLLEGRET